MSNKYSKRILVTIISMIIYSSTFGQLNLQSFHNSYMFNPAIAMYDTTLRVQVSYSNYDSYSYYSFSDIAVYAHVLGTRFGVSGFLQMYDYSGGPGFYKPMNALISLSSSFKLNGNKQQYLFVPSLESGISSYALVTVSGNNEPIYKLEEHDERVRISAAFTISNLKWILGIKYQGINRPDYKIDEANQWLGGDLIFMRSFSNLFGFVAGRKMFEKKTLSYFLVSSDRFPYSVSPDDHYYALRRLGICYSKPRYLVAASCGILNNNERFREYKGDFVYRINKFDLGLKVIYCDDPPSTSFVFYQSGELAFPLSNAFIVNFALTYHFSKTRGNYSSWDKIIVF